MNTLLFAVGTFVFMITVYGTVMAGGATLRRKQREDLAPDIQMVVKDDGWEIITSARSGSADRSESRAA
ncbi:MAG: hypothetical protein QNJ12_17970 [Ilumatobacter sp.]|uniref:hypothetical protein n=1 Tax=Ilumatobacter sp. TaxID=1967498 RepID=UPI002637876C|nr:hypothetical protein [Ilumatobacter sp.]MDJ0770686.1 hypothetical protein [Ilumatobacter sp.]